MTLEQHPIWDQAALLGRLRGKTDRVAKLINLYLMDMPERMNTLSQQVEASDLVEVIASAHTIKGVSANLGIVRLQHKAAELEVAAKESHTEKVQQGGERTQSLSGIALTQVARPGFQNPENSSPWFPPALHDSECDSLSRPLAVPAQK